MSLLFMLRISESIQGQAAAALEIQCSARLKRSTSEMRTNASACCVPLVQIGRASSRSGFKRSGKWSSSHWKKAPRDRRGADRPQCRWARSRCRETEPAVRRRWRLPGNLSSHEGLYDAAWCPPMSAL